MLTELVLSANKGGPAMYAWDLRTGTVRTSFKQCDVGHHSVAAAGSRDGPNLSPSLFLALKSDCLSISAYSWSKELPMLTFRCPEKLACIAASPDGVFCAAGAYNSGNVYVWEIATGTMLACFQAHRGTVTVIRFSNDGTLLITGGHDALVQSWIVSNVVAIESLALDSRTAHTTMADHSLPITDIQVGGGTAASGRIVSTGRDGRCNVWDLATGELVVTFVLPCPVWSAVIDPSERFVYMGCDDGLIRMASLYKRNATTGDISSVGETTATVGSNVIAVSSASSETAFIGHSQAVRSLSLSFDATLLVSGSDDGSVNVWDTVSRKALRTFTGHKGAQITHVDIIISP
ncbi:WD40 repeat-like protein, partial [Ramicandelaber brevisporus]